MSQKSRPSVAALADLAGVSKSTVSMALSDAENIGADTREKIRRLAADLGYQTPRNRPKSPAKARAIGVLLDREFDWAGEQFFTRIIRSLQDAAEHDGLHTVITTVKRECIEAGKLPEIYDRDLVHSIVAVGITHPAFIETLKKCGKPVVLVSGGSQGDTGFDCVLNDDFQGMEQVIRHLTALGHKDIALIGGRLEHMSNRERFRAFRIHMDEIGGGYNASHIHVTCEDASITDGRKACDALVNAGIKFTALVCMTDDMAYGAIESLKKRGIRVPDDVSVCGFNDLALSEHVNPPLTSVRISCEELGKAAHQVVRTRLSTAGIAHALRLMVGTNLIVRGSTGSVGQMHMGSVDVVDVIKASLQI